MHKALGISATVLKMLLGIVFLFSAFAKFVDIETLSIYIYSYNLFPLLWANVIAWLVVSGEMLLGIALISNRRHKLVCNITLLVLLGFTIFLVYAHLSGRTDSCHCFGELVDFSPLASIVKNAVFILWVLFVSRFSKQDWHPKWWLPLVLVVFVESMLVLGGLMGKVKMTFYDLYYTLTMSGIMAVVGIMASFRFSKKLWVEILLCSTPFVATGILSGSFYSIFIKSDVEFNQEQLDLLTSEDGPLASWSQGRKVVSFFSSGCPYCKLTAQTLSIVQEHNKLPEEDFLIVFPKSKTQNYAQFFKDSRSKHYSTIIIPTDDFVKLTYGQFPLVMLLENGRVVKTFSHGNVPENEIVKHLQK